MLESKLQELPSLSELASAYLARKSLGQNFLIDPNLTRKIVEAADITPGDTVVEVGPGLGSLTRLLLLSPAQKIIVIEKDERFIGPLEQLAQLAPDRLKIHIADAFNFSIAEEISSPCKLISNLPYNVGTQLVLNWLNTPHLFLSLTVMMQKEVVERILAQPGAGAYGRLGILLQWLCVVKKIVNVPPHAFKPKPKVSSAVVQLIPRPSPLFPAKKKNLEQLTHLMFQQRRKMVRSSLKGKIANLEESLKLCNVEPTARPETIAIESLCKLSHFLN